ncbi:MAG: hypothetical protein AB8G18_13700 [Gammaproteobacteria bacterium]
MLLLLLALNLAPIIAWLYLQGSISLPGTVAEREHVFRMGAVYVVLVAGPALILSLFTMLYALVGLLRNPAGRLIHLGQLVLALITLALLSAGAFALVIAVINPG